MSSRNLDIKPPKPPAHDDAGTKKGLFSRLFKKSKKDSERSSGSDIAGGDKYDGSSLDTSESSSDYEMSASGNISSDTTRLFKKLGLDEKTPLTDHLYDHLENDARESSESLSDQYENEQSEQLSDRQDAHGSESSEQASPKLDMTYDVDSAFEAEGDAGFDDGGSKVRSDADRSSTTQSQESEPETEDLSNDDTVVPDEIARLGEEEHNRKQQTALLDDDSESASKQDSSFSRSQWTADDLDTGTENPEPGTGKPHHSSSGSSSWSAPENDPDKKTSGDENSDTSFDKTREKPSSSSPSSFASDDEDTSSSDPAPSSWTEDEDTSDAQADETSGSSDFTHSPDDTFSAGDASEDENRSTVGSKEGVTLNRETDDVVDHEDDDSSPSHDAGGEQEDSDADESDDTRDSDFEDSTDSGPKDDEKDDPEVSDTGNALDDIDPTSKNDGSDDPENKSSGQHDTDSEHDVDAKQDLVERNGDTHEAEASDDVIALDADAQDDAVPQNDADARKREELEEFEKKLAEKEEHLKSFYEKKLEEFRKWEAEQKKEIEKKKQDVKAMLDRVEINVASRSESSSSMQEEIDQLKQALSKTQAEIEEIENKQDVDAKLSADRCSESQRNFRTSSAWDVKQSSDHSLVDTNLPESVDSKIHTIEKRIREEDEMIRQLQEDVFMDADPSELDDGVGVSGQESSQTPEAEGELEEKTDHKVVGLDKWMERSRSYLDEGSISSAKQAYQRAREIFLESTFDEDMKRKFHDDLHQLYKDISLRDLEREALQELKQA